MLRYCWAIALAFVSAGSALAQGSGPWTVLMDVEQAQSQVASGTARVIDIRHRKLGYDRGHIPESVSMPLWSWRGEKGRRGTAAAAPIAAAAPVAAAATAPPVQIDVGAVEVQDGRQVAEVVAMYGRTALDVAHVGQTKSRKGMAVPMIAVGGLMMVSGLGLFGYETTQDWETYSAELRAAKQAKKPEPAKPGYGTGAPRHRAARPGPLRRRRHAPRREDRHRLHDR